MRKWISVRNEMILVMAGIVVLQLVLLINAMVTPFEKFIFPYLIILFYCVFYLIGLKIYRYCMHLVGFFLTLLTFIRYLVIPCMILFDKNYLSYSPLGSGENALYFRNGCFMTLWEAVAVGFFLAYVFKKWYSKEEVSERIVFKNNLILWLAIGVLVVFVLVTPAVLSEYNFVLNLANAEVHRETGNADNLLYTISFMSARVLKLIIPVPFVQFFYSKYLRTGKIAYYLFSAITIGFFYALIMEGNSRNSIIIPAVAVFLVLYRLYPKYRKMTVICCFGGILGIVGVTLIWKSFLGNADVATSVPFSYWVAYVEQYFDGIANVGRAIEAKEAYDKMFELKMVVNDLFQNMPIISSVVDAKDTSFYYFLKIWGRNDQIMPAIGNGMFYFGYLLAPLVPMFIITLAHIFEKKVSKVKTVPEIIVYTYAAVTVANNSYSSVSNLGMKLSIYILPTMLIIWANRKFRLGKKI